MTNRTAPPGDDDWGDDLSALDYGVPHEDEPPSLDALGEYAPHADDDVSSLDALGEYVGDDAPAGSGDGLFEHETPAHQDSDDDALGPLFAATNPPGTITVTAFISGALQRVDLSPLVTTMTESELSQEIRDLAAVATEKARAGQFVFLLYAAVQQVGDSPAVRDLLNNTLGLPTPEQAAETEAAFARRYIRNED